MRRVLGLAFLASAGALALILYSSSGGAKPDVRRKGANEERSNDAETSRGGAAPAPMTTTHRSTTERPELPGLVRGFPDYPPLSELDRWRAERPASVSEAEKANPTLSALLDARSPKARERLDFLLSLNARVDACLVAENMPAVRGSVFYRMMFRRSPVEPDTFDPAGVELMQSELSDADTAIVVRCLEQGQLTMNLPQSARAGDDDEFVLANGITVPLIFDPTYQYAKGDFDARFPGR